ncbi:hypothetical protein HO173_012352 [Letharia columbiana]|uniref:Uncharacterized protein n=1 Tax=Letharia columbiana TaxID=112416 RepID=A0A8H6CNY6_9LECA|nr:uncharacterized protein HO173_012352 [Letharia columbiana]KAF6226749.1 hypothetical protein HO173_012352 [Letharia columbiana]
MPYTRNSGPTSANDPSSGTENDPNGGHCGQALGFSSSSSHTYGTPNYYLQQQSTSGYLYPHGHQTLRPPPLNAGYHSRDNSNSGYATRVPSVASPQPQQSYPVQTYPVQSYPVQSYPVHSYVPSRQLGPQKADRPGIEVVHTAHHPNSFIAFRVPLSTPKLRPHKFSSSRS